MPEVAFVNGAFVPFEQATVHVEDRGFQFGDGVYEVLRTYGAKPFALDEHLLRLARSADAIDLSNPYDARQWRDFIGEGVRRAAYAESKIYIQLTRGVAPRDHLFPQAGTPTTVMTIRELHYPDPSYYLSGVSAVTVDDLRWGRCDIKSLNLLPNVLARQRARDAGAFEAILIRNGILTEGAISNVMVVINDTIITPPEGPTILGGVTRLLVLDLARRDGLAVAERQVTAGELMGANEVFLTGTTLEVMPVVRVNGVTIGNGRPGRLTTRAHGLVQRRVAGEQGP